MSALSEGWSTLSYPPTPAKPLTSSRYFTPLVTSRYFSQSPSPSRNTDRIETPTKRRKRTLKTIVAELDEEEPIPVTSSLTDCRTSRCATDKVVLGDNGDFDRSLMQMPAFVRFADTFIALFDELWTLKPILIQEHINRDPWKLLVAVMFLNKTAGKHAIPVYGEVIERWSTPEALAAADPDELMNLIRPLGLQKTRARRLIQLSHAYIQDPPSPEVLRPSKPYVLTFEEYQTRRSLRRVGSSPTSFPRRSGRPRQRYPPTPISHLPGVGPYALDSYRIFCSDGDEWEKVMPTDKELIKYLKWKWAVTYLKLWVPWRGVVGGIQVEHMQELLSELSTVDGCHGLG